MNNLTTWTTQDGQKLKISEMESRHIKNCIKMLEKQIEQIKDIYGEEDIEMFGDTDMTFTLGGYIPVESMLKLRENYILVFTKELDKRGDL